MYYQHEIMNRKNVTFNKEICLYSNRYVFEWNTCSLCEIFIQNASN